MTVAALNRVDAQAAADRHEERLTTAYRSVLNSAGKTAASRFRRTAPITAAAQPDDQGEALQPNWTPPNIDELVDLAAIGAQTAAKTKPIHRAALKSVSGAYSDIGISFDVTNPLALTLLAKTGGRAGDVAKSVRDDLQKIIGAAYTSGLSVNNTAAQITALSDQFSAAQSKMLARTDLNGIANGGAHLAASEVGVGFKTWLATSDELTRPTHEDANGQTVPIDEPFDVGGDSLDYPGDPDGSDAETINCRCTLTFGDSPPDGSAASDLAASGAITTREGGDLSEAQITIPLTVSIGMGERGLSRSSYAEAISIKETVFAPNPADDEGDDIAAPTTHAYMDDGSGQCAECGMVEAAQVHETLVAAGAPTWRAILCVEGEPTEDGRLLDPGSITWRDLPLSLMCQTETAPGHDGAEVCGRIDRIWRDGSAIMGEGVFDSGAFGLEAARLVAEQTLRGISVDLAVLEYEIRSAPDADDVAMDIADGLDVQDDPDELFVVTDGVIGAATICPFQAIASATITVLTASGVFGLATVTSPLALETLTASAVEAEAPIRPPAAWFDDPQLDRPTLVTVTDDGRVFGHVAPWRGCHTGYSGRCVPPPRSRTGYAGFHVGRVETAEGDLLPIGRLTLAAPHADINAGSEAARRHYDNTSSVAAFVRAGEDAHGVWVAGALRPGIPPAMIQDLLANPLSGDWRNGEMVAAHAVPVPGFPILQASAIGDGGEETALILTSTIGLFEDDEVDFAVRSRVLAASARGVTALAELVRQ